MACPAEAWKERTHELRVVSATGHSSQKVLLSTDIAVMATDWSLDGRTIAITFCHADRPWMLQTLTVSSAGDCALAGEPMPGRCGHFSPAGRLLLYESADSGRQEVLVATWPDMGHRWQISNEGGSQPQWVDGLGIVYRSARSELMRVAADPTDAFEPGPPEVLFRKSGIVSSWARNTWAASRDGHFVIIEPIGLGRNSPAYVVVLNWMPMLA